MLNISPTPWTLDEYGSIRDANDNFVYVYREPTYEFPGNKALLLAAPALLEFWRSYASMCILASADLTSAQWSDAVRRIDAAVLAAKDAVRALEE